MPYFEQYYTFIQIIIDLHVMFRLIPDYCQGIDSFYELLPNCLIMS